MMESRLIKDKVTNKKWISNFLWDYSKNKNVHNIITFIRRK